MPASQVIVTAHSATDEVYILDTGAGTWTTVTLPTSEERRSIATDRNGTYIVGSASGIVHYSTDDGATWTALPGATVQATIVMWNGSEFVATTGVTLHTSPDGINWTQRAVPEVFGAAAFNGFARTSIDGYILGGVEFPGGSTVSSYRHGYNTPTLDSAWGTSLEAAGTGDITPFTSATYDTPLPRRIVTNSKITLGLVGANGSTHEAGDWSDDAAQFSTTWTAFTHTGNGGIYCAAWNPAGDYWIGGGAGDSPDYYLSWAYSADGKAWTHYDEAALDKWILVDVLWDGTYFWFAAAPGPGNSGGQSHGSVFRMDPVDPTVGTATWTEYPLPGTEPDGAWTLAGYPTYDQNWPYANEAAHIELHNANARGPIVLDEAAHIERHAPDAQGPISLQGQAAHLEVHAPDVRAQACSVVASTAASGLVVPGGSLDLTIPAEAQAGDILVLGVAYRNRLDISVPATNGLLLPGPIHENYDGGALNVVLPPDDTLFVWFLASPGTAPTGKLDDGHDCRLYNRVASDTDAGKELRVSFETDTTFSDPSVVGAANAAVVLAVLRGATWAGNTYSINHSGIGGAQPSTPSVSQSVPGLAITMVSWQGTTMGSPSAAGHELVAGGDVDEGDYPLGYAMFSRLHPGGAFAPVAEIPEAVPDTVWGAAAPYYPVLANKVCAHTGGFLVGNPAVSEVIGYETGDEADFPEDDWYTWPAPEPTPTPEPPVTPWGRPRADGPWRNDQGDL